MNLRLDEMVADHIMGYDPEGVASCLFAPSLYVGQAFQVVKKMKEEGYGFEMHSSDQYDLPWYALFYLRGDMAKPGWGTTEGAAICYAALLAKGFTEEEINGS